MGHGFLGLKAAGLSRRTFLHGALATAGMNAYAKSAPPRQLTVLDAPSNLGLKPPSPGKEPGVRYMAEVLRDHGLVARLHAEDGGTVKPPRYGSSIDPLTRIRNAQAIHDYSIQFANRLGSSLDERRFPLVLGGDCSILLGSALALQRRGRYGLLFIDGHTDLLTPETSESGGAAGMDLALVTGIGPKILTHIESAAPSIQPADVVVFGYRWPAADESSPATAQPPMKAFPLDHIRNAGIDKTAADAINHLEDRGLGFWTHVDLDVLSPDWMAAVDSPDPGGMTPTELTTVLRKAIESRRCVGVELTIYDPERDPTGRGAELIVDILSAAFGPPLPQPIRAKTNKQEA
jgi:arginase